jgi:tripeptidyl-peptidase-1
MQTIVPTMYFSPPRMRQQTPRKEAAAKVKVTSGGLVTALRLSTPGRRAGPNRVVPALLRWMYKTENYVPVATDRNVLGVVGFLDEFPSQKDLTTFMDICRTDVVDATFTVVPVNGGIDDPSHPSDEANMYIQYAESMVYPTPLVFYSTGGDPDWLPNGEPKPGNSDLEWFNHILSQANIPQTISITYGSDEKILP